MVLRANKPAADASQSASKFEAMDDSATDVAVAEKPAVTVAEIPEQPAAQTAAAATPTAEAAVDAKEAAKAATETAVVVANAKANAVVASKKFVGALSDKENVFDPSTLDFNTFPRVTVGLDGFSDDSGRDLGKVIKIEVMSYNTRWVASPGTDDEESKKFVRYSLDGKTIDSNGDDNGMDIQAYINEMKTVHGLEDAGLKEYLAIYGFLTFANGEEIAEADRDIVGLQVPPQSRALFTRHQMTEGVKIQRGIVQASDVVVCTQEKKSGSGTKKFALIHFSSK